MSKCSFRDNRKAYLKRDLEKVRHMAAMLWSYLHVGGHEENICASKSLLHSHAQTLSTQHPLSLSQIHVPFTAGQSP